MNMKKSIAGVMAGAMAVSAMAAAVSADQDSISLTYDLKTYVEKTTQDAAKVTVVANYEGSLISEESIANKKITFGADNVFVTGGVLYEYGSSQNVKTVFAKQNDAGQYVDVNGVAITVGSDGWTSKLQPAAVGSMTEFEFTARPYKDLNQDLEEKYQTYKATGKANTFDGSVWNNTLDAGDNSKKNATFDMPITTDGASAGAFNLEKYKFSSLGYSDKTYTVKDANGNDVEKTSSYGVRDAVAKMTYIVPAKININAANGWGWNSGINADNANGIANEFGYFDTYKTADVTADLFALGFNNAYWGKNDVITSATALVSKPSTVAIGSFTAGTSGEKVVPFKTTLNPGKKTWSDTNAKGEKVVIETPDNDVIKALQNRKAGGNYYTRPLAVINDAIANHDNVVFTFASYGGYVATEKSHLMNQWVETGVGYDYETSGKDYDWHNPAFGQHLYTNVNDSYSLFDTDDYDMYGSYSSAWGINLFTGAVVVNQNLTMQLSDTDKFDWGESTLSFDWFDIIDDGKITDAKTFLTSMLLYTPVDWYWDSLTVVVSDEEDESVDASTSLDGEGDVIEDEEPEEIVEETEPEIVEEPEVVETEAAPVETAPSPATGNAPVALAVIPVALAAAAVVAKKRG